MTQFQSEPQSESQENNKSDQMADAIAALFGVALLVGTAIYWVSQQ